MTIETGELVKESSATLTVAKGFAITSAEEYTKAAPMLAGIKALQKKIDDTFDPHIKRAFEAHRSLVAEKKSHLAPLAEAESHIKRALLGFQQEEERKRRDAEARAQEAARKEQEKLRAQAEKATARGKTEKAEALTIAAESIVAPVLPTSIPKIAGLSTRTTYHAKVTNFTDLIRGVAAGATPEVALEPNMTFLNNQARAMKQTLSYPGVEVVEEQGIASKTA